MADKADTTPPEDANDDLPPDLIPVLEPHRDVGKSLEQIRSLVENYIRPKAFVAVDPVSGTAVPGTMTQSGPVAFPAHMFDDYLEAPRFRHGTANFDRIESLIEHVKRFKDGNSALFARDDRTSPAITAVLDYHEAGAEADPRFGKHRSLFRFPLSDEWKAWTEADGKVFSMVEFAAFLEDRIIDVLELIAGEDSLPEDLQRFINICGGKVATPNRLVELSRGLHVNEKAAVKEAISLASGEGQIIFESEHVDQFGGKLQVPGLFLIGIPVFKNGPPWRLAARLRYRKTPAGIVFFYELWRSDRAFDSAFSEAAERVRVETELPMFFGAPEA